MDSPLFVLLPLAAILAFPIYAVLKGRSVARTALDSLVHGGFDPSEVFDMSDMIVAIDSTARQVAFVNISQWVFPRGMDPPIDRDSFSTRTTGVASLASISSVSSTAPLSVTISFCAPNCFNLSGDVEIAGTPQDALVLKKMLNALQAAISKHLSKEQ